MTTYRQLYRFHTPLLPGSLADFFAEEERQARVVTQVHMNLQDLRDFRRKGKSVIVKDRVLGTELVWGAWIFSRLELPMGELELVSHGTPTSVWDRLGVDPWHES